jgi:anthocyanidin 3-O-glucosyltransferase
VLRDDVGDAAGHRADELLTSHPGLGCYRLRDLPDGVLDADNDMPIIAMFRRIAERLPRAAAAVALNTFPGLVPDDVTAALAAELPECLPVGPFHLLPVTGDDTEGDPYGCLAWLDSQPARAVVYVSFGTIISAWTRPEELHELAAGMEASGAPFLWSLPEGSWPKLPAGFLERAKVVPWAPQADVLRHASVGAFVTHAGWASVLEGVCGGVPMACRPFFSDQKMNARLVAHVWRVGMMFDEPVTRGGLAAAVSLLLTGEEGDGIWGRMQELKGKAAGSFAPDGGSRDNLHKLANIVCAVSQV